MIGTQPSGGKPGVITYLPASYIEVCWNRGRPGLEFITAPVTIDGTATGNALNSNYPFIIFAGTLFGRETANLKYANSIIGLTSSVWTNGASTTLTVASAVATEIVRRVGASGTLNITGGVTAGAAPNVNLFTYTNVVTSTGVLTGTMNTTNNIISGALVQPTDGSQNVVTVLTAQRGLKVTDATNINRIDVFEAQLLLSGCVLNDNYLQNWPSDVGLQNYLKAAIKNFCPNTTFLSDQTG